MVTASAQAWDYVDQNRTLLYAILGGIVLIGVLAAAYIYYQSAQNEEAADALGQIVVLYEQGNYEAALNGDDTRMGLLGIIDAYGGTETGNLATFYAADASFRLGQYEQALDLFEDFDKDDNYLGASAYAGEGAVHEQMGNFEVAGDRFREAALVFENEVTTPQYLLQAGHAYEQAQAWDDAIAVYTRLQEGYPTSQQGRNVEVNLARVQAQQ